MNCKIRRGLGVWHFQPTIQRRPLQPLPSRRCRRRTRTEHSLCLWGNLRSRSFSSSETDNKSFSLGKSGNQSQERRKVKLQKRKSCRSSLHGDVSLPRADCDWLRPWECGNSPIFLGHVYDIHADPHPVLLHKSFRDWKKLNFATFERRASLPRQPRYPPQQQQQQAFYPPPASVSLWW